MINPEEVSVVLVTRGNVSLWPILDTLNDFAEVIVWDNSQRADLGLYGRYAAIAEASSSVVVTQDDDLIVTCWPQLLEAYEPGVLTINYPEPWDIPWVARGAVFDRGLPEQAFQRYDRAHPRDRDFTHFLCDGIFALLAPRRKVVDYGSQDLPYCNDAGRISSDAKLWYQEKRPLIQERCASFA